MSSRTAAVWCLDDGYFDEELAEDVREFYLSLPTVQVVRMTHRDDGGIGIAYFGEPVYAWHADGSGLQRT